MKKKSAYFFLVFTIGVVCVAALNAFAAGTEAPKVGIVPVTDASSLPSPGLSGVSGSPSTVTIPAKSVPPTVVPPTAGALSVTAKEPAVKEPVAVLKDVPAAKIEIQNVQDKKTAKQKKAEDKARTEALEEAMDQQVEAMRAERSREMPYLDRMYIRTTITPLMVQKKEAFLGGGPKTLTELIRRAQSVHTKAKAAHENIALSNRRMLVAFRKLFPEVSFALNDRLGSQQQNSLFAQADSYTGKDWKVSLKQPIFSGGVLWNAFLQERSNLEAAKREYDTTIADLVFNLSEDYFEYQRTLQTVAEYRETLDRMKKYADLSEQKYKEKIIAEIEHLNTQSLYSQTRFDLESATQEFEIAKLNLQKYLDLSSNDQIAVEKVYNLEDVVRAQAVPAGGAALDKTMPDVFAGEEKAPEVTKLIDLSYGHRPELQSQSAKLQATRFAERVRWGEFLPKVNLSYDFGALGEAYLDSGDPTGFTENDPNLKKQWMLMLELTWNVGGNKVGYTFSRDYKAPTLSAYASGTPTFLRKNILNVGVLDGLDAFVGVKDAEVNKLNQVVELEKAEKQVLQDVKKAYYDYQKAIIQVHSAVKRLEYRKRMRDFVAYKVEIKKEGAELSELLQAETDLVREKVELHKALKEYFSAKAALNHAVGIQDFLNVGTPTKKVQS